MRSRSDAVTLRCGHVSGTITFPVHHVPDNLSTPLQVMSDVTILGKVPLEGRWFTRLTQMRFAKVCL